MVMSQQQQMGVSPQIENEVRHQSMQMGQDSSMQDMGELQNQS